MEYVFIEPQYVFLVFTLAATYTSVLGVELADKDALITLFRVAPTDELGIYKYAYGTSNGINVQAAGSALEQIGIFSYVSPEGTPIEVRYIADELGFHAVGRHLPRPPSIPDYILRSIEYNRRHPDSEYRGWKTPPKHRRSI
ncbi:pupal cuticle protein Edg-78E-like [Teleopsis dalmanni]|uniref:pupal cuticle protein Edg-78E n=1 Tax=Teleopsis dalmanni TaxID=139649 RepID=UPI0018CFDCDA|nr:pupal cuticle protein Edg-78E [Teleopsis dalmanni]XP_037945445.1 pupal cuticle protein Edg-78E-like [Teleopsis dalmanni]